MEPNREEHNDPFDLALKDSPDFKVLQIQLGDRNLFQSECVQTYTAIEPSRGISESEKITQLHRVATAPPFASSTVVPSLPVTTTSPLSLNSTKV